MQWLMDYISRRKNKKTKIYKAAALPDGEMRDIMLAKQDSPVNERGLSADVLIQHWREYGQFEKLEAGYAEPSQSADALCAGCMFFLRNPWGESDTCQIVTGNVTWYGTCKLRIDANEQARIVYAAEIGEYAEKAERKARALPVSLTGGVSDDKWDGPAAVADMDIAALKKGALAFVGGDADSKSNYKLPYRGADGKINAGAVRAIKAVIGGARGGVDLPEGIRAAVEANADKLMRHVEAKTEKVKKQFRAVVTSMDKFAGGTFVAKALGDGVTEISGRLSSGAQAVYAYTLGDGWTAERAAEYVAKSAAGAEISEEEFVSIDIPIAKRDDAKRIVYGVVLQPDVEDLHGDIVSADEIEKACHAYTAYCRKVNDQHADEIKADVVENYIAPLDFVSDGGAIVKKGSWVQVTKVFDDAMWAAIQSGERTGYSYEGWARRTPVA